MRKIDTQLAQDIISKLNVSKGLTKRLSLASIGSSDELPWQNFEIIGIPSRDGVAGVLLIEIQGNLYAITYDLRAITNNATGHAKPIICDFCKTWQSGARAGSITFRPKRHSLNSVSFLCCLDLKCSLHVRDMTNSARTSRSQLREDISQHDRIQRLSNRLATLIETLKLKPIIINDSEVSAR